jgi:purine-nucleoside phosphorylase
VQAHPATIRAQEQAAEAAEALRRACGVDAFTTAVVLGSGWLTAAEAIGPPIATVPLTDIPHFAEHSVAGHAGEARVIDIDGRPVLVFLGRTHAYEGHGVDAVTHAVRTASCAGATSIVLTNGCGSLQPAWEPGTVVLIADHINLTGLSPLHGAHFVDLTDLYTPRLRDISRRIDPDLPQGVYVQLRGPAFETPAEIRMLRTLGADLVGMSTALEAIVARSLGMEILGLSLVTNLAAGISDVPIDHADVLATGQSAGPRLGRLLADVLHRMD